MAVAAIHGEHGIEVGNQGKFLGERKLAGDIDTGFELNRKRFQLFLLFLATSKKENFILFGIVELHNDLIHQVQRIHFTLESGEGSDACLLYTSDAADDLLCVDLGGRRIIKKKKT